MTFSEQGGGTKKQAIFFSYDHAGEVHREAKEINDPVWDCTLIKQMRENKDTIVNPIYKWTNADVWDYLRQEGIKTNPLYDRGYTRVGCIGCPMATYKQKQKEFADFPKYKNMYLKAFAALLETRKAKGKDDSGTAWETPQGLFDWWIQENMHNVKGQLSLFDDTE